eukprot:3426435-Pyramimonas_sp.AAC.1
MSAWLRSQRGVIVLAGVASSPAVPPIRGSCAQSNCVVSEASIHGACRSDCTEGIEMNSLGTQASGIAECRSLCPDSSSPGLLRILARSVRRSLSL